MGKRKAERRTEGHSPVCAFKLKVQAAASLFLELVLVPFWKKKLYLGIYKPLNFNTMTQYSHAFYLCDHVLLEHAYDILRNLETTNRSHCDNDHVFSTRWTRWTVQVHFELSPFTDLDNLNILNTAQHCDSISAKNDSLYSLWFVLNLLKQFIMLARIYFLLNSPELSRILE